MVDQVTLRLRYVLSPREETGRADLPVLSVYREHGVIPKDSRTDNHNKTPENLSRYQRAAVGDLVVNKMKAWSGSVAVSRHEGIVSPDYLVCRVSARVLPNYLHHMLRSERMVAEMRARSLGIRPGQERLYWDDLADIDVTLPPLDEQRRIADFLDDQVGHFDRMVSSRRRLVELLTERAEHAIRQHIADGLAGEGGALRVPLKRVLTKVNRPPNPAGEVITAFRDGQVTARSRRRTGGFTEAWTGSATVQGVNVGDVVIHGLDGFAGAIGTSASEGVCSPAYHVCVPADGGDPHFAGRMLRILALSDYLSAFGGSARQRAVDFRNWGSFSRAQVPVVARSEQERIGALLRQIRELEDAVSRYAALIGERKQAMITSTVTGQFDVTTSRSVV